MKGLMEEEKAKIAADELHARERSKVKKIEISKLKDICVLKFPAVDGTRLMVKRWSPGYVIHPPKYRVSQTKAHADSHGHSTPQQSPVTHSTPEKGSRQDRRVIQQSKSMGTVPRQRPLMQGSPALQGNSLSQTLQHKVDEHTIEQSRLDLQSHIVTASMDGRLLSALEDSAEAESASEVIPQAIEQSRLDLQSHIVTASMDGRLLSALEDSAEAESASEVIPQELGKSMTGQDTTPQDDARRAMPLRLAAGWVRGRLLLQFSAVRQGHI
jgi:hypothetical protein